MDVPAQWDSYKQQVEANRTSVYLEYPAHVHIETMTLCNGACTFCPYPDLDRRKTIMPDALIAKIIDDLTAIPSAIPLRISPFKVNEPFLDKRIFAILGRIEEKLPNARLSLTSNGTPLDKEKLESLAKLKNVTSLAISFNDHRPEAYTQSMSLPYERTLERLTTIHEWKIQGRLSFDIVLTRVGDGTMMDQTFRDWAKVNFPSFGCSVLPRGTWIGQVETETAPVPNLGCIRWFELSIVSTGKVAHCCMDGKAEWPIGDVTQDHVLEIYNQPHYRRLRETTASRLHAAPCNRCTFL